MLTDDEIHERIADAYGSQLASCELLLALAHNEMATWSGRAVKRGADRIILAEVARATKTFDAVARLCRLGFGEQAAMLNRSLFEAMVVAHWTSDNRREAVGLFVRHHEYTSVLWYETFDALGWLDDEDVTARPTIGPKKRAELKKLFGKYGTEPWTKRSLPAMLREIEHLWDQAGQTQLWAMHDVPHRHNNQMLHSTATAVSAGPSRNDEHRVAPDYRPVEPPCRESSAFCVLELRTGVWPPHRRVLPARPNVIREGV